MGVFRDMKDMVQTVRSDELKELKKKTAAHPRVRGPRRGRPRPWRRGSRVPSRLGDLAA